MSFKWLPEERERESKREKERDSTGVQTASKLREVQWNVTICAALLLRLSVLAKQLLVYSCRCELVNSETRFFKLWFHDCTSLSLYLTLSTWRKLSLRFNNIYISTSCSHCHLKVKFKKDKVLHSWGLCPFWWETKWHGLQISMFKKTNNPDQLSKFPSTLWSCCFVVARKVCNGGVRS